MVVTAVVGASVVGAVGANMAAGKSASAANKATAAQQGMFDTTQANLSPYIAQGDAANNLLQSQLPSLSSPVTLNQTQLQQTPGYQFALTQGLKSAQNSAAARGLGVSGAAEKGAEQYATGLADQTYQQQFQNALTNKQNSYNELTGATQIGANAAAGLGQISAQVGSNEAQTIQNAGNAQAQGILGASNSLGGGLQNAFYANKILGNSNNGLWGNASGYNSAGTNFYDAGTFDASAAASGLPWSDVRLKENIVKIGHENGFPIYEFSYLWSPKKYIGVMAQEIKQMLPNAVKNINGYFAVDYKQLGVKFREVSYA